MCVVSLRCMRWLIKRDQVGGIVCCLETGEECQVAKDECCET